MTRIQEEVGRLLAMAGVALESFPKSTIGKGLVSDIIPALESLRARAQQEIEEGGITKNTYDAIASLMATGEGAAWEYLAESSIHNDVKLICRQFDHIHVLMNVQVEDPAPPETHKCFPPGSEC